MFNFKNYTQSVKALVGSSTQFDSVRIDKTRRVLNKTGTHKGIRILTLDFGTPSPTIETCVSASLLSITQSGYLYFLSHISTETWQPKQQYWSFFRLLGIRF